MVHYKKGQGLSFMDRYYPNQRKFPKHAADCVRMMLNERLSMTRNGLNCRLSGGDDIHRQIKIITEGTIG